METGLEALVHDYDRGRLTRRQLLARLHGLIAVAAGARAFAAEGQRPGSTFQAVGLNHIALTVGDIRRSREFYARHLGLTVSSESDTRCFLTFGTGFLALFRGRQPGMDHYCYSVEDYRVDAAAERLRRQGIEPRIEGSRIYFDDPDGLEVQLSAPDHRP
jgi:predicted enzyme related to lactoylglutathione lyase